MDRFADLQPFPKELAARAARFDTETPERWMYIVVRREKINYAVGRIVHVGRVSYSMVLSLVTEPLVYKIQTKAVDEL